MKLWWDGVIGCAVAALMCGCVLAGTGTVSVKKAEKPKVKLSELCRARSL